jgi:hypothetical protein
MTRNTAYLLAAAAAVAAMILSGAAYAGSAAPKAKMSVVPIVMADPGCHWFQVGGKKLARLTVNRPTAFRNLDEAAVVFKSKNFFRRVAVGKTIAITKAGLYRITMVGQHGDDNHLLLVVK